MLQGRLLADDTTPAGTFTVTDTSTSLSLCSPPNVSASPHIAHAVSFNVDIIHIACLTTPCVWQDAIHIYLDLVSSNLISALSLKATVGMISNMAIHPHGV